MSITSLGRRIIEYQPVVSIHGENVVVRAKLHTFNGFSAHAGQSDLLKWLGAVAPSKPRVILTPGENDSRKSLLGHIQERFHLKAHLSVMGDVIEL